MNKVVIVTGASRGIGAATALLLAKQNYKVCVNYLNSTEKAKQIVKQILADGGEAFAYKADVSIREEVTSLYKETQRNYGTITHLVNNVGILFQQTKFSNITPERFEQVLSTNVLSAFHCCQAFISQLPENGAIVNVSSGAALSGSPFEYIDYAASKGAIDSLTIGLAKELASKNIRVNGVRPGFIYTDMHADGGEPERVDRLKAAIPLKRGGNPEEVAEAIAWLLSDNASFTTGKFIDVTGGI